MFTSLGIVTVKQYSCCGWPCPSISSARACMSYADGAVGIRQKCMTTLSRDIPTHLNLSPINLPASKVFCKDSVNGALHAV